MIGDFEIYLRQVGKVKISLYEHSHIAGCVEAKVEYNSPQNNKEHTEIMIFRSSGASKTRKKITSRLYRILEFQKLEIERKLLNKAMPETTPESRKRMRRESRRYY